MTNGTLNDFQRQQMLRSVDYRMGEVVERIDTLAATVDGLPRVDIAEEIRDLQSDLLLLIGAVSKLRVAYVDEVVEGQRTRAKPTETE